MYIDEHSRKNILYHQQIQKKKKKTETKYQGEEKSPSINPHRIHVPPLLRVFHLTSEVKYYISEQQEMKTSVYEL